MIFVIRSIVILNLQRTDELIRISQTPFQQCPAESLPSANAFNSLNQPGSHIRERFPNNPYFSVDITRSTPLPKTMIFKKETKDNELYLYMNGKLIYKKWLDTGVSKVFDIQAYDKYTLTSIKDTE